MWGCFHRIQTLQGERKVFPTHVGVFLIYIMFGWAHGSLPHACGGVSNLCRKVSCMEWSSPRMWGCFYGLSLKFQSEVVFPTHVGVFPPYADYSMSPLSLPHACGGVSEPRQKENSHDQSSPRMWGCFSPSKRAIPGFGVFPTHVGVFPSSFIRPHLQQGLPHACGGVSKIGLLLSSRCRSSPRMWGCF